jgi:hypothetical protein
MIKALNEITRILGLKLFLNFYNYTILLTSDEESLLKKLRDEFHYFTVEGPIKVKASFEIFRAAPPQLPSMVAKKILETCTVYKMGHRQFIDYGGKAQTVWDTDVDKIAVYSSDLDFLYELSFLAVHSLVGQELDRHGICRVHALGFSLGNINTLVMLPSKGGKSTLLSYVLQNPEVKIISDDMPLIDFKGRVYPFPSKISMIKKPESGPLSELQWTDFTRAQYPAKWTAGLAQLKDRIETHSDEQSTILVAGYRLSSGKSLLTPIRKWKMIGPVMQHMIMGIGLPQILEMFLQFQLSDFFKMIKHGMLRAFCAFQLVRKSECYYFYMGDDCSENAQMLTDLSDANQD